MALEDREEVRDCIQCCLLCWKSSCNHSFNIWRFWNHSFSNISNSHIQSFCYILIYCSFLYGLYLTIFPTIFIRKDYFECQLGFYIIDHERNHLLLRESEKIVEEETLRKNRDRIIPILLSNHKICKDCPFFIRKIFSQATFNYLNANKNY